MFLCFISLYSCWSFGYITTAYSMDTDRPSTVSTKFTPNIHHPLVPFVQQRGVSTPWHLEHFLWRQCRVIRLHTHINQLVYPGYSEVNCLDESLEPNWFVSNPLKVKYQSQTDLIQSSQKWELTPRSICVWTYPQKVLDLYLSDSPTLLGKYSDWSEYPSYQVQDQAHLCGWYEYWILNSFGCHPLQICHH